MVGELFMKSQNSCIFVVARRRPRTDIAHNLACNYAALLGLVSRCRACVDSSGADVVKYADDEPRKGKRKEND